MSKVWGGFLTLTGFVACPCHLPLTLPLMLGALGGTAVGGFVGAHSGLIYGAATAYFLVAISVGLYLWNRKKRLDDGLPCPSPLGHRARDETEESQDATTRPERRPSMPAVERFDLKVRGQAIHCAGCEAPIENALKRMPGVVSVKADHKMQTVRVAIETERTTAQIVRDKLSAIGYPIA